MRDGGLSPAVLIDIDRHDLGEVDGVRLCFSDATAVGDVGVLFSAVAEAGEDTYRDGLCAGAAVGMLRPDRKLDWIRPLDPPAKVEGIEVHRAGTGLDLLMVADPDDPATAAPLLAARLSGS